MIFKKPPLSPSISEYLEIYFPVAPSIINYKEWILVFRSVSHRSANVEPTGEAFTAAFEYWAKATAYLPL